MNNIPQFKPGELLPIYALLSSEGVLVQDALKKLKHVIAKDISETNTEYFHAAEVKMDAIIQSAQTLPFLSKQRFIHIGHVEKLKTKEHEALIRYIEAPNQTTLLCLSGAKIDQRTKLGKSLVKHKFIFNMSPPNQKELPRWLIDRAKAHQCTLDMDAAFLMTDLIGNNLALLERALEKTILYAHPQKEISFEHIQECVAATRLNSVFELTDAIGERQFEQALLLLNKVISGGESGLLVLSMLARHLRQLIGIQNLSHYRLSDYDLAKEIGSRHFLIKPLREQSSRFSHAELKHALQQTSDFDLRLKSSRVPPAFILQEFLSTLMSTKP